MNSNNDYIWRFDPATGNIHRVDRLNPSEGVTYLVEHFTKKAETNHLFKNRIKILVEGKENTALNANEHPGRLYSEADIQLAIGLGESEGILDYEDYDDEILETYLTSFLGPVELMDDGSINVLGTEMPQIKYENMMKLIKDYAKSLQEDEFMTLKETAEYLSVSQDYLRKILQNGDFVLPTKRIGKRIFYSKRIVNEFLYS